jgi:hypothetical protein
VFFLKQTKKGGQFEKSISFKAISSYFLEKVYPILR